MRGRVHETPSPGWAWSTGMAARNAATVARRTVADTLVGLVENCWTTVMWRCWNSVVSAATARSNAPMESSPASRRLPVQEGEGDSGAGGRVPPRGRRPCGVRARREPQQDEQEKPSRPGARCRATVGLGGPRVLATRRPLLALGDARPRCPSGPTRPQGIPGVAYPRGPRAFPSSRNRTASVVSRRMARTLRTAMAQALGCPMSTTSCLPRVTPV